MEMVNGYVFLDLTKSNVYAKALKVLGADKPVVIKDNSGAPYFVDSLTLDGTNIIITKGGKTITIANDNTITNVGDIQPLMENIVDLNGNKRFVEGDITTSEITGVTFSYAKWSLSGSHLMVVLAGEIADATTLSNDTVMGEIPIPQWIKDKIIPLFSTSVEIKEIDIYGEDYSNQQAYFGIRKLVNDTLQIIHYSSLTTTLARKFRLQFDLLIDSE